MWGAHFLAELKEGVGFVLSHLSDKNKDVAKVGHLFSCWVERAGEVGGIPPFRKRRERMGHRKLLCGCGGFILLVLIASM